MRVPPAQAPRNRARADALRAFRRHADATNDIFHLAAQVIARTIVQAERLLGGGAAAAGGPCCHTPVYFMISASRCPSAMPCGECVRPRVATRGSRDGMGACTAHAYTAQRSRQANGTGLRGAADGPARAAGPSAGQGDPGSCWRALQAAWTPFAAAWRAPWWECVAAPEDVADAAGFRQGAPPAAWAPTLLLAGLLSPCRLGACQARACEQADEQIRGAHHPWGWLRCDEQGPASGTGCMGPL